MDETVKDREKKDMSSRSVRKTFLCTSYVRTATEYHRRHDTKGTRGIQNKFNVPSVGKQINLFLRNCQNDILFRFTRHPVRCHYLSQYFCADAGGESKGQRDRQANDSPAHVLSLSYCVTLLGDRITRHLRRTTSFWGDRIHHDTFAFRALVSLR